MSLRRMFDRKLVLMVVTPVARALLSLAVGYLTAKGVPPNLLDQFVAAIGVSSMVVFNITWELVERKRATAKAVTAYKAFQAAAYVPFDHVRDRFDREAG
jgi:hypothetical protein